MRSIVAKLRSRAWWNRKFILLSELVGRTILSHRKSGHENDQPRHIGLIVLHQIGDLALATPTITAIREMFPSAHLTIIAGRGPAQLITDNHWEADVVSFDALWQPVVQQMTRAPIADIPHSRTAFRELVRSLETDVLVAFQPDRIVNQLMIGAAPRTIGFSDAGGGFFLTNPIADQGHSPLHQIELDYLLAKELGRIYQIHPPALPPAHLSVKPNAAREIDQRLRAAAPTTKKIVILHPYPSAPKRAWIPERWHELASWLITQSITPIIIGGKSDSRHNWPSGTLDWTGQLNLTETLALLARASALVAVDSGPGHLATTVGTPVISVFSGTNDPKRWAPFGTLVTVLTPPPAAEWEGVPYEDRKLPTDSPINPYTEGITVQMVIDALRHNDI